MLVVVSLSNHLENQAKICFSNTISPIAMLSMMYFDESCEDGSPLYCEIVASTGYRSTGTATYEATRGGA